MSCNGCRVLRKGCSEVCILRSCLHWIKTAEAQGNATLFLAKFFGRSDLLNFISSAPENQRPAVFQSLLFEACGRTVNPVNGAVGLLSSGNWHVCEAAVETVLTGGALRPIPGVVPLLTDDHEESTDTFCTDAWMLQSLYSQSKPFVRVAAKETQPSDINLSLTPNSAFVRKRRSYTMKLNSEESEMTFSFGGAGSNDRKKLLNLFV